MAKPAIRLSKQMHSNPKLIAYLKKQPAVTVSLKEIQKSLSHIGVSLSKRVTQDRKKR